MSAQNTIQNYLTQSGIEIAPEGLVARIAASIIVLIISVIAYYIAKRFARSILPKIIIRTRTTWDDSLVKNNVFVRIAPIIPAVIIHYSIPIILNGYLTAENMAKNAVYIFIIIMVALVIDSLINALHDIYQTLRVSREIPLKSFCQVLKIILYFICIILLISILLGKSPIYLLSGLGAMTAVLLLVFKDAILGFVAGIQLISNKMLKHGDWIEMAKYGADGDVMDITLTTVKVSNWDRTITTIPTYALMTDSFKNWRGMQESGGRRIKRSIHIDMGTIKFCTVEMIERFERIEHIKDYIAQKKEELKNYNSQLGNMAQEKINCRQLTNIGVFRAYVQAYLKSHPMVNQNMTFLIRQLEPTQYGLPIQIYVFCKDKAWANYEAIQSDIFDHLLTIVPEFDLRIYQSPSGQDLGNLIENEISGGIETAAA
ncbi:MAG: mechanosensitive ion channel [Desulfobacteraceae bacterium]|nr:mechanosensitive ion channel [Desulfobacteraceae bacterium]